MEVEVVARVATDIVVPIEEDVDHDSSQQDDTDITDMTDAVVPVCDESDVKECLICFEEVSGTCNNNHKHSHDDNEESLPASWRCASGCVICLDCLQTFLSYHVEEKTLYNLVCPGYCQETRSYDCFKDCGLDEAFMKKFRIAYELAHNPDCIVCPSCEELTNSKSNRPNLTCSHCQTQFCYFHGLEHAGRDCEPSSLGVWSRIRTRWWVMRNTRKCRMCQHHIQKNGGCNHMTCRCGHEICWQCGGDYRKNGRSGHSRKLFPAPSELKYQCNDAKLWALRVGVVTGMVPVVCIGAGLIVGLSPIAGAVYGAASLKKSIERKRQRAHAERMRRRITRVTVPAIMCANQQPEGQVCLSCSGLTTCTRHRYMDNSPFCANCNHFDTSNMSGCFHFFGGNTNCVFCSAPSTSITSDHPEYEAIHANVQQLTQQHNNSNDDDDDGDNDSLSSYGSMDSGSEFTASEWSVMSSIDCNDPERIKDVEMGQVEMSGDVANNTSIDFTKATNLMAVTGATLNPNSSEIRAKRVQALRREAHRRRAEMQDSKKTSAPTTSPNYGATSDIDSFLRALDELDRELGIVQEKSSLTVTGDGGYGKRNAKAAVGKSPLSKSQSLPSLVPTQEEATKAENTTTFTVVAQAKMQKKHKRSTRCFSMFVSQKRPTSSESSTSTSSTTSLSLSTPTPTPVQQHHVNVATTHHEI